MKNIYFVQSNSMLSDSVYLPYAVGSIAAYSFSKDIIKENYTLKDFIFIKKDIDSVVEEMENPFICGFSCYMWNIDYNLALAKKIKETWENCIILFGGPQIPDTTEYLEQYDFIDILIHGEGEIPFYNLLKSFICGNSMNNIDGISFRNNNELVKTKNQAPPSLENFPSPYEMGLFDSLVGDEKYRDVAFNAILETNRGCPYGCIYCYFSRNGAQFRKFPIERIKTDIRWIAENKISYCVCADSNFGILDRDESIADYVIEMKKSHGYPDKFETASAKNKDDYTFRINKKLEENRLNRGISLAVQSMSDKTLEIIGRKNMSINNIAYNIKKYRDADMSTYTDLILGLPGETKESFLNGMFELLEAGQHYSINVYRCEVLPNTKLSSDEIMNRYSIKTIESQLCQRHSLIQEDLTFNSRSNIIVQTDTMSQKDWFETFKISTCIMSFHCMGLLRYIAIYLHKTQKLSYRDFYMQLYDRIEKESTYIKKIIDKTFSIFDDFFSEKSNLYFSDERFGNIYWDFDEGLFMSLVYDFDSFYAEIFSFLKTIFDDSELLNDLLSYQKAKIALPDLPPRELSSKYDWEDYFEHLYDDHYKLPVKKTTRLKFEASATKSWEDYAREIIWYGRRSNRIINKATK